MRFARSPIFQDNNIRGLLKEVLANASCNSPRILLFQSGNRCRNAHLGGRITEICPAVTVKTLQLGFLAIYWFVIRCLQKLRQSTYTELWILFLIAIPIIELKR